MEVVSALFKWVILTITTVLLVLITFFILNLIKHLVLNPVELLTAHIQKSNKNRGQIDSYESSLIEI